MKILTWDTPNYGDRLNDIVWQHYIADKLDDNPDKLLVGIGSLLNHRLPATPHKVILGSGFGHGDMPTVDDTWRFVWVRGPLTVKKLGLDPKLAVTDGGMLLADMVEPAATKEHGVSFIPHCSADDKALAELERICSRIGVHLIDPNWPLQRVLHDINSSRKLITEALHGAITADALRVPWIPVARSGVFAFKWNDWMQSIEMEYRPKTLPYKPDWFGAERKPKKFKHHLIPLVRPFSKQLLQHRLGALAKSEEWLLSDSRVLKHRVETMKGLLHKLV
ncbi:MAG: hypothetical protein B7Y41_14215 [Hydrogenophilales bacterium 28-61-23]|nr:MAG: hypothetical protein B7Y41_14215 [Hydrogenophilales bacterium 28-61-23]